MLAIVNTDLRYAREEELLHRVQTKGDAGDVREYVHPQKSKKRFGACDEIEKAVGRLQKILSVLKSFFVVGRKDPVVAAAKHHCKLPRQVVSILDPRVHSLRSGGSVDVSGIAREEASSF